MDSKREYPWPEKRTIILLVLILFAVYKCLTFVQSCMKLDITFIDSEKPGPTVLLVGGTHGNEPAGTVALENVIKSKLTIKKGRVIIIPRVNGCGLTTDTRANWVYGDINRKYPDGTPINAQVYTLLQKADWIIDMHEGWGFRQINKQSLGSGIYPTNTPDARSLALMIADDINLLIKEPKKKFVVEDAPHIKGTLREMAMKHNKNYILIETSGQNNIQPMEVRTSQHTMAVLRLLRFLGMS